MFQAGLPDPSHISQLTYPIRELRERSKGVTSQIIQGPPDGDAGACLDDGYEAPAIAYLGTLRELTLGGTSGPDDGVGGAGGIGSL
jgi:hypothetical protein